MFEGFYIIIGAILAAFGSFLFTWLDDIRKRCNLHQLIAKALYIEIITLKNKTDQLNHHLFEQNSEKRIQLSVLYHTLKGEFFFIPSSERSFICEKNAFEVFERDLYNLQIYLDVANLIKYYGYIKYINSNFQALMNMGKDILLDPHFSHPQDFSVGEGLAPIYLKEIENSIINANLILKNSNVEHNLIKICNQQWLNLLLFFKKNNCPKFPLTNDN